MVWNNLSVPDKNIYASVTSVCIVIVDWCIDRQLIQLVFEMQCSVVSGA